MVQFFIEVANKFQCTPKIFSLWDLEYFGVEIAEITIRNKTFSKGKYLANKHYYKQKAGRRTDVLCPANISKSSKPFALGQSPSGHPEKGMMIFSVRISKASVIMRFLSLSLEDKFHSKPRKVKSTIKTVQGQVKMTAEKVN